MRSRSILWLLVCAGCAWHLGIGTAAAQDIVRSVVVTVDGAGRLAPVAAGPRPANAKRYWADTPGQSIKRSNLDGTAIEEVVSGLADPYGLSLDPTTGTLLWTSSGNETVETWDPSGGPAPALETEFEEPYAIVHEIEGGLMAYAVVDGQVVRSTQQGDQETEQVDVLMGIPGSVAGDPPHGLSLDSTHGVLYVGDYNGMMTHRIRLSDGLVETLAFVDEPFPAGGGIGSEEVVR